MSRPPFRAVYEEHRPVIQRLARSSRQYVRGMSTEDVTQEIAVSLWESYQRWDPTERAELTSSFLTYWRHRRQTLNAAAYALQRAADEIPQDIATEWPEDVVAPADEKVPPAPELELTPREERLGTGERYRRIWHLVALGFSKAEIQATLGISQGPYYDALARWRELGAEALGLEGASHGTQPAVDVCRRGHPRTAENVYMYRGYPRCKVCDRDRDRVRNGSGTWGK